jgi:rod shape-determining protein MreC
VPRTRSARVAVLGSVQRPPSAPSPPRSNPGLRRRAVATALVLVSLLLLTVYFRESPGGTLHDMQSTGASVLRPFEVAAERVARPFRDAAGWFGDVLDAKSENEKLRKQLDDYRQQAIRNQFALQDYEQLKKLLAFRDSSRFPNDYRAVATRVISRAPSQFEQQIGIAAGSSSEIRVHDPVVTADGLVGQVTKVANEVAQVTLLTDETSAVSALDFQTQADGIVQHGVGSGETLVLDRVPKDQVVNRDDVLVTAGWRSDRFASIYPRGIPIGVVTSVGQTDTDLYKQVLVQPFVHFSSVRAVLVLVPKKRQSFSP